MTDFSNTQGQKIASWIRSIRTAAKMTQTQFAEVLRVEQGTVSRWERGSEPTLESLGRISEFATKIGMDRLLLDDLVFEVAVSRPFFSPEERSPIPILGTLIDGKGVYLKISEMNFLGRRDAEIMLQNYRPPMDGVSAVGVSGINLGPIIETGNVLILEEPFSTLPENLIGRLCFVELQGGHFLVGKPWTGRSEDGVFIETPKRLMPKVSLTSLRRVHAILL